jgi:serine-type D-Ala-D-Ala carboxypeptidase (penicillin-binding protein 5/6)
MTAILVLENMDLNTEITASRTAALTPEPKTWLKEGDVLTVEQFLYALLLRSANSAAVPLAEGMSGSVDAFVARMNAKAQQLGMTNTHFVNPNGLDATGHYSTAADMAKLARYAMSNERFRMFVHTKTYSLPLPGRSQPLLLTNTNKLLVGGVDWVIGVKTGLTPKADQCFVGAGTKNGVSVISVILGEPNSDLCFTESKALMQYGFTQLRHITVMNQGVLVAEGNVPYKLAGHIGLVTARPLDMELYKDEEVTTSVELDRSLTLPVSTGDRFGRVLLTSGGETVGSVDLVADGSFGKTTLGSKLAYFWGRFKGWLGRVI